MHRYDPVDESAQLARLLREHLHEMMAASQPLRRALAGNGDALHYMALLERGMCRQLHLARLLELDSRLNGLDEVRLSLRPVDLVELCRSLMERVDDLSRLLDIRVQFGTDLTVLPTLADRQALEDMLLTLAAYCVKTIGRSGTIRLELERQDQKALLTLTDTGPGLDAAALAVLSDSAEAPDDIPDHTVRSLALAQQIAALHGGVMIAGSAAQQGVSLAVSLPLLERTGHVLRSPDLSWDDAGGWDQVLIALSDSLPPQAFLPEELDG